MKQETVDEHNKKCEEAKTRLAEKGFVGEWNNEPNRINWVHAGLDCMMVRHFTSLHWCGYVGVKPNHPAFKKGYDAVQSGDYDYDKSEYRAKAIYPGLDIHGGLTYASECGGFVCHATNDTKDETWWLGFDCAHSGDISPSCMDITLRLRSQLGDTYKNVAYVTAETNRLAEQLAEGE